MSLPDDRWGWWGLCASCGGSEVAGTTVEPPTVAAGGVVPLAQPTNATALWTCCL